MVEEAITGPAMSDPPKYASAFEFMFDKVYARSMSR